MTSARTWRILVLLSPSSGDVIEREHGSFDHIWAAHSPENSRAMGQAASTLAGHQGAQFSQFPTEHDPSTEATLLKYIDVIDTHIEWHDRSSSDVPWLDRLEVRGAPLTPSVRDALVDIEYEHFETRADGFVAQRFPEPRSSESTA